MAALAYVLMAATVLAFALVALGVRQVPALVGARPVLAAAAAGLATLLLVLFWRGQLVIGLLVNALLVTGALARRRGGSSGSWAAAVVEP